MINNTLGDIKKCIDKKQSFILDAGAGSGKTKTLIDTLTYVLENYSNTIERKRQKVVCITYTNVATQEILDRIDRNDLVIVSTIHSFIWVIIKQFQSDLKRLLIEEQQNKIENLEETLQNEKIKYELATNYEEGCISHDDVLNFAKVLFIKYPKLSKITSDKYPFIFVDEYQDTSKFIVDVLTNKILKHHYDTTTIGFFGDYMQHIYDSNGVGEIKNDKLERITKQDNFRCSLSVIKLLNNIRSDLIQQATGDNVEGSTLFIHSNGIGNSNSLEIEEILNNLEEKYNWDNTGDNTKVLLLTHRKIANSVGYGNILKTCQNYYKYKEILLELRHPYIKFLSYIEGMRYLYQSEKYHEIFTILPKNIRTIYNHKQKETIASEINVVSKYLLNDKDITIGAMLDECYKTTIFAKPVYINEYEYSKVEKEKIKGKNFIDELRIIKYQEVINVFKYLREDTPFSTKHGVKGTEFENVLVIIDDKSWPSNYNFNYFFSGRDESQYERTRKLLYVCCSRAKNNLAILMQSHIDDNGLRTVNNWFGTKNTIDINTFLN